MSSDQQAICAVELDALPAFDRDPSEPTTGRFPAAHDSGNAGSSYRPGELIASKYELCRLLRNGGMGSVWVARHLMLDISIAIKLIRTDLPAELFTERFVSEARLAARLEHPGIVSVFDLGVTERGHPFIAMELLIGEDLRELLNRERRLDPVQAVKLLLPVAAALASAHDQAIVHRDLKPENVFVARAGERLQPKIIDFGIAKSAGIGDGRLTWAGSVVGSPDYMAPEQARGLAELDQRVDVWAFCAVLYECVTGDPPFAGTAETVLEEIISKPVCPITERGVFDLQLSAIIQQGLEKEPERRWQNMRELGRVLAQWLLSRWVDEDACGHSLRSTWLKHDESTMPGGAPEASAIPPGWVGTNLPQRMVGWPEASFSPRASGRSRPRAAALVATGAVLCAIGSALGLGFRGDTEGTARLESAARSVSTAGRHAALAILGCPSGRARCAPVVTPKPSGAESGVAPKPSASATPSRSLPRSRRRSQQREYDFGF